MFSGQIRTEDFQLVKIILLETNRMWGDFGAPWLEVIQRLQDDDAKVELSKEQLNQTRTLTQANKFFGRRLLEHTAVNNTRRQIEIAEVN